jgi:predicted O-methyltransferase YrrM
MPARDPFAAIQAATRRHRAEHGCGAYTFEDGPGLAALAAKFRPGRIVELGTALGYTACCLAGGDPAAHVDTVEADAEHVRLARAQIAAAGLAHRITVHHGAFRDILPTLRPSYGMAFFDGFRPAPYMIEALRALLAEGGVLVCANLQHAKPENAATLEAELADPARWRELPAIEGGGTRVLVKKG